MEKNLMRERTDSKEVKLWHLPNFKAMLLLSAGFFFMLFSFYSSVNVYSKVLKDNGHENLGFQGLAVMYLFFAVGCFLGPSIASRYKR
jgi:hypothetical protein